MFYIANWGSCQLMFRFPKKVIDLEQMRAYGRPPIVEEFVSFTEKGEYVILKVEWREEAPEWGWIEGEDWLPRLMGLRDDILRGDYRLLYLAWLKAITLEEEMLDEVKEPPLPPGLRQLSPGLQTFIELFELDEHLVAAAAEASGSPEAVNEADLRRAIGQLSPEQGEVWLLRLAQGEPQLSVAFNRELAKLSDRLQPGQPARRTLGDLQAVAERIQKDAQARRAAEAQARHLKKMETLAARESQIWREIVGLLEQKTASAYDQAVNHLADLRDLAQHRGEPAAFQTRLNKIYRDYHNRSALIRRLHQANLYEL
ncbi:MAG: hypothetical protein HYR94_25995 [Chloroflexi bacterium]|nr:hypothetical protein [Chloroflexota bacterium]